MHYVSATVDIPMSDESIDKIDKLDAMKVNFRGTNIGVQKELFTREFVNKILNTMCVPNLDDINLEL